MTKELRQTGNLISIIGVCIMIYGCAALKPIARTINDVGNVLCELFAVDQSEEQRDGLSPSQWCAIKEHVDPFIAEALAAKQAAGLTAMSRDQSE